MNAMWLFNKGAHVVLGSLTGWHSDRPWALKAVLLFLGYQGLEVVWKHDKGSPEIKEFGVAFAGGILARKVYRWYKRRYHPEWTRPRRMEEQYLIDRGHAEGYSKGFADGRTVGEASRE